MNEAGSVADSTALRRNEGKAHSFDPGRLDPGALLAKYLREARQAPAPAWPEPDPGARRSRDAFASEVAAALREAGARVSLAHPLAGLEIDLVYALGNLTRGIDLPAIPSRAAESSRKPACLGPGLATRRDRGE